VQWLSPPRLRAKAKLELVLETSGTKRHSSYCSLGFQTMKLHEGKGSYVVFRMFPTPLVNEGEGGA
jgi:hypothetical protein